jgi:hypothetical protein
MTQNESAIEQINLGYNEPEDRLLLRLGLADKTEVAVWLTRRICKAMWSLLQSASGNLLPVAAQPVTPAIATPDSKNQAIESFAREAAEQKAIENMDFKSAYTADRQTRSEEPMLAVQCVIISSESYSPENLSFANQSLENQALCLELQCKNGQSVKIALTNELVHAITNMMQLATREAGWDLLMTVNNAQVILVPAQQVLH